jgi:serine/threonine protein kinase
LYAFSDDGPCKCLVLELCTGGALDSRLFGGCVSGGWRGPPPLKWAHRVRIAHEIALALAHLHSLHPPVLHRGQSPSGLFHQ